MLAAHSPGCRTTAGPTMRFVPEYYGRGPVVSTAEGIASPLRVRAIHDGRFDSPPQGGDTTVARSVRAGAKGRPRPTQRAPQGRQKSARVSLSPLRGSFILSDPLPRPHGLGYCCIGPDGPSLGTGALTTAPVPFSNPTSVGRSRRGVGPRRLPFRRRRRRPTSSPARG